MLRKIFIILALCLLPFGMANAIGKRSSALLLQLIKNVDILKKNGLFLGDME